MLPKDDEPSDPRRYRRTLVPLDIEDAEQPPSFRERLARIFRKKDRTSAAKTEEPSPDSVAPQPTAEETENPEWEDEDSDQNL